MTKLHKQEVHILACRAYMSHNYGWFKCAPRDIWFYGCVTCSVALACASEQQKSCLHAAGDMLKPLPAQPAVRTYRLALPASLTSSSRTIRLAPNFSIAAESHRSWHEVVIPRKRRSQERAKNRAYAQTRSIRRKQHRLLNLLVHL